MCQQSKLIITRLLLCSIAVFFGTTGIGFAVPAADDCIQAVEQQYAGLQDFCANFEQQTTIGSLQRVETAEGTVCYKKTGKMYWEYKKPTAQQIYLFGDTLWFYLPEDKQAMKNDTAKLPADITADLFAGTLKIRDKFTVARIQEHSVPGKQGIEIELIPKQPHPNMKRLTLWLDCKKRYIIRSALEDEIGNLTVLQFSKFKVNKGISDRMFIFTPPAGVDIFEPPALSSPHHSP